MTFEERNDNNIEDQKHLNRMNSFDANKFSVLMKSRRAFMEESEENRAKRWSVIKASRNIASTSSMPLRKNRDDGSRVEDLDGILHALRHFSGPSDPNISSQTHFYSQPSLYSNTDLCTRTKDKYTTEAPSYRTHKFPTQRQGTHNLNSLSQQHYLYDEGFKLQNHKVLVGLEKSIETNPVASSGDASFLIQLGTLMEGSFFLEENPTFSSSKSRVPFVHRKRGKKRFQRNKLSPGPIPFLIIPTLAFTFVILRAFVIYPKVHKNVAPHTSDEVVSFAEEISHESHRNGEYTPEGYLQLTQSSQISQGHIISISLDYLSNCSIIEIFPIDGQYCWETAITKENLSWFQVNGIWNMSKNWQTLNTADDTSIENDIHYLSHDPGTFTPAPNLSEKENCFVRDVSRDSKTQFFVQHRSTTNAKKDPKASKKYISTPKIQALSSFLQNINKENVWHGLNFFQYEIRRKVVNEWHTGPWKPMLQTTRVKVRDFIHRSETKVQQLCSLENRREIWRHIELLYLDARVQSIVRSMSVARVQSVVVAKRITRLLKQDTEDVIASLRIAWNEMIQRRRNRTIPQHHLISAE
jgi:hypothetical protein